MTRPHLRQQAPDPWVLTHAHRVQSGPVLDLACGGGRHGRVFLNKGLDVHFLDRDLVGVADLQDTEGAYLHHVDLEDGSPWPFTTVQFQAILVVNYLHRPLLPKLVNALKPGGLLLYKTFADGNQKYGRPSNPDFLLRSNELLEVFDGILDVLDCRQQKEENPTRITQCLCAIKPGQ
ncbi:MAG: class I SAM-dependent methyltransferase [Gammaproteobacteria bacterium]|nr:MAG: class I SAM-dependent methyltransferase [Gammaproteobacteria bacterium]